MKWPHRPRRPRTDRRSDSARRAFRFPAEVEALEARLVLSAAFDVTDLTGVRNLPEFAAVDGALEDGTKIGIAVIDSGIMGSHADLRDNFVAFFDAVATDAGADGGVTPADSESAGAFDPDGHGTHIAGIAASSNPDIGVAPRAGLIGIRGLTSPGESLPRHDSLLSGLKWVEENHQRYNIKVVNLSIQNGTNLDTVPNANDFARQIDVLESLGIVVVASTGNSYADYAALGASFPAVYATLSVASTWEDGASGDQLAFLSGGQNPQFVAIDNSPSADQLAASSQRSSLPNQVAAPGSTIFSTWNDGGYNTLAGTSMAAGFVSGLVALVQDAAYTFGGRYLSVHEAAFVIRETADIIFDGQTPGTERAPLIQNEDGTLSMGTKKDLQETGRNFRRVNVLAALAGTRSVVNPRGEGDLNSILTTANVLEPLDGGKDLAVYGRIGSDGPNVIGPNDVDIFRVSINSRGRIRLLVEPASGGQNLDPYVRIFDSGGSEIASQNDAEDGSLYPDLTTAILDPGVYYLGISSFANTSYDPFVRKSASGGGSVGDYQLTVSFGTPDPNGVIQAAEELSLANPNAASADPVLMNQGVFATSSVLDQELNLESAGDTSPVPWMTREEGSEGVTDVDFYRVIAPDSGILFLATDTSSYGSEGIDTFLRVYAMDASGEPMLVAANDDAGETSTDSVLEVGVVSGQSYFIAVSAAGLEEFDPEDPYDRHSTTDDPGRYDLHVSFSNGDVNGTGLGAVDFATLDEDGDGVIDEIIGLDFGEPIWGDQNGREDVDFFLYTATQDGLVDISLLGVEGAEDSLDGLLGIWELASDQTSIRRFVDQSLGLPRALLEVAAGQSLWISVTGQGNQGFHWAALGSGTGGDTGTYRLSIQERPASDLALLADNSLIDHTPSRLELGQLVSGNIGLDGQTFLGASDVDLYAYTAPVNQFVLVQNSAHHEGAADTYLRVFDAEGNELAANNDAGTGTRGSEVTVFLTAGETYFVGVNGFGAGASAYDPLTGENAADGSTGGYSLLVTELPAPIYAAAADAGGGPHVRVFDARTDLQLASFFAYDPRFHGGVRVAVGDVTGDGVDDVVTVPGPGGGPHVRVLDGATRQFRTDPAYNFFAFQTGMSYGLNVAAGDVNGDGFDDIIVAPDAGGSPVVRAFSGRDGSQLHSFFAYDFDVTGGVRLAAGDVNGDGFADIITVPGPGSSAHLRVFAGQSPQSGLGVDLFQASGLRIGSRIAYPGFLGGAYVAAGDVDGDGLADVILGAGAGGGPHVMAYSGANDGPLTLASFFAYASDFRGGVRVATGEFRLDGRVEIITSPGPGSGPHVRIFEAGPTMTPVADSFAFGNNFLGGVFVAGGGDYRLFDDAQRLAEGFVAGEQIPATLGLADLAVVREAAIGRLAEQGLSAAELDRLERVQFALADLPGQHLGLAFHNTVLLDVTAGGIGWYLDPTPWSDEEFAVAPAGDLAAIDSQVQGVDLLSVILHELGHHLNGEDLDAKLHPGHVMADTLAPARRRVPEFLPLDAVYADDGLFAELL